MATKPDIRAQLRALSIPKDQRPAPTSAPPSAPGKSARARRWGIAAIMVLAATAGVWRLAKYTSGMSAANADPVRLVTVTPREAGQPMPVTTATGKIVSDHKVLVNTKVSGQIVQLMFEQGDRVKDGQVLAKIEDVTYRALRDEAAAQLDQARANLVYREANFTRIKDLHERASAPDIEFIEARKDFEAAQAEVRAAESTLKYAQKALTDCAVLAPIAGVILERNVEVGDFVAAEGGRGAIANAQLCSIADMTELRVEVDISELDIARIKKDMPCVITPDAYKDRRYDGYVMWLDPGANYSKATVQVKVRIKDPDPYLRVEGSAQVQFLSEAASQEAGGLWVPTSATLRDESGARVFTVREGRARATAVQLGRQIGNQVEVLSGLTGGETIIADNPAKIADGQRISSK